MKTKVLLAVFAFCALGAGFLAGAYQASISGANFASADPYDEMPGYGSMYNGSYYWGRGMGMGGMGMGMMGMGMMGPMYGYGMYNDTYYGGMGLHVWIWHE